MFAVSTHGPDPRVKHVGYKINGLAGQGDPTRVKPVSHGSIGRWGIWSGQKVLESRGSGRVGSGDFQISRVRSGRVTSLFNLTGRARSGKVAFKLSRVEWDKSTHLQRIAGRDACEVSRAGSGQTRPDQTREV